MLHLTAPAKCNSSASVPLLRLNKMMQKCIFLRRNKSLKSMVGVYEAQRTLDTDEVR